MRVHHLNCGTMCPLFARLVHGRGGLTARGRLVCHCLLIETRDGLVLVDTGLGTGDVAEPVKRLGRGFVTVVSPACRYEETALAQVQALGFKPSDVRFVLPTHLDLDHAGGLGDFPEAEVHLMRGEHAAATQRATRAERSRYRPAHWAHTPYWRLHDASGEAWLGFESVRPLPGSGDDILIIPLYGHTRGHAGIAVRTSDGWLLHAGDAYFHHAAVHPEQGKVPPGLAAFERAVETQRALRLHNQERLRALVRAHPSDVRVVCAHDPDEFDALAATA